MFSKTASEVRNYVKTCARINIPGVGSFDSETDSASEDSSVKKFIDYYKLNPNDILPLRTKNDLMSFFAPAKELQGENPEETGVLDKVRNGGVALLPGDFDKAITAHELGHASSPLLMSKNDVVKKVIELSAGAMPITVNGLVLGGMNHAAGDFADLLTEKMLNSKDINMYNPKTFMNPKLKAGLAATAAAAYAPMFAEETLTNLRATKALWDTKSDMTDFLTSLPSLGLSQLSYTLPMLAAAGMIYPALAGRKTVTIGDKLSDLWRITKRNITSPGQLIAKALTQRNMWNV